MRRNGTEHVTFLATTAKISKVRVFFSLTPICCSNIRSDDEWWRRRYITHKCCLMPAVSTTPLPFLRIAVSPFCHYKIPLFCKHYVRKFCSVAAVNSKNTQRQRQRCTETGTAKRQRKNGNGMAETRHQRANGVGMDRTSVSVSVAQFDVVERVKLITWSTSATTKRTEHTSTERYTLPIPVHWIV